MSGKGGDGMATKADLYYQRMTETPVGRLIISLGIPTTISMLITNIYNMADTYFVGTLGASAQGATGVLFTLQAIIQALSFMLGHGSGIFVSKELADKNVSKASRYVSSAFYTGIAAGTGLMIVGLIFLDPFMRLLGSTETILPHAKDYGLWVLLACPFMVGSLILNNNLRYEGKAFYAMFGLTTGGILNILGDYILIEHCHMGVFGAGLATAASQVVSFVILLIMYERMAQSKIRLQYLDRDVRTYLSICKVGLPSLIRQGLTSISNGLLNNLTKPFGDAAIAAMSVVNRYSAFVMCIGLGIGQGFQPVAAFNYQSGHYKRVKKGLLFTAAVGFVLVLLLSAGGFTLAEQIVYLFQKDPAVIEVGIPALRYASIGLLFLPLSIPVNMLYQSIRKAGISSFLSLLRSGVYFMPLLLLGSYTLGLTGIQLAQPITDLLNGLTCIPFMLYYLFKTPNEKPDLVE